MSFSVGTFFLNTVKTSPALYALVVVMTMTVVALAIHAAMEKLVKLLRP